MWQEIKDSLFRLMDLRAENNKIVNSKIKKFMKEEAERAVDLIEDEEEVVVSAVPVAPKPKRKIVLDKPNDEPYDVWAHFNDEKGSF